MNIHGKTVIKCPGTVCGKLRNMCKKEVCLEKIVIPPKLRLHTDVFRVLYTINNPNQLVCPDKTCGNIVEINPLNPVWHTQCQVCNAIWCRMCACYPYHEGESCIEYEIKSKTSVNGLLILKKQKQGLLKFCPTCRTPIEKVVNKKGKFVACNKIICSLCSTKWCWLCKKAGIDYSHFNSKSKSRCANKLWEGVDI